MAYDSDRSKIIMFGGFDNSSKSDTWEWDGTEWTQIADTGPPPRAFHSMTYDSSEKQILLFGGADQGVYFGDTWILKNNTWAKVQDMGPGPLVYGDMVYAGSRAVLFG